MDKRGQEFSVTTLVVIVLAIIVLVVLALGFGAGWSNLWSKITGYLSPVNVDAVKQACTFACTTQAKYDYCCLKRNLVIQGTEGKKDTTTHTGANAKPCKDLISIVGLEECSDINCNEYTCPQAAEKEGNSKSKIV